MAKGYLPENHTSGTHNNVYGFSVQCLYAILTWHKISQAMQSTYFGGLEINDGSMCNGAGGLYGPKPPDVNGATLAM